MSMLDELRAWRDIIYGLAARHGITDVRVFDSVARGEERPDSDVDFLVKIDVTRSLMDLSRFRLDIIDLLAKECDIVSERGLHPLLRDRILIEARPL